ncbi:hypothetical protein OAV92_01210 [Crocinitomicaceae bacterium]|nr:hypothetical protein [Crocinitomicaceae bacterium]
MKHTPNELHNELHNELMDKLSEFTDDLGYHLPPDKIPDTTKSLINLFITYSTPPPQFGR